MVAYTKATQDDYEELVTEADFIFTEEKGKSLFRELVPKAYEPDSFQPDSHYIVKEDGKIVALVLSDKNTLDVCGKILHVRGIGTVGVDNEKRSKGYMKVLMNMALEDMKKEDVDFAFLGGQRQRYEYFSFTPTGVVACFHYDKDNARHVYGKDMNFGYQFEIVPSGDTEILDAMYHLYQGKLVKACRPRSEFYRILISWRKVPVAIKKDGNCMGYFLANDKQEEITEIVLQDDSRICEILTDYLTYFEKYSVDINYVPFYPVEFTRRLSLVGNFNLCNSENMTVFHYQRVLDAFFRLKSTYQPLSDGTLVIEIIDREKVKITVKNHIATVERTDLAPDVVMPHLIAMQVLFGVAKIIGNLGVDLPDFAHNWFPLPLFYQNADGI